MNIKKKIISLTLISFLSFLVTVVTLSAQERIVGVAEGDWFKYGDFTVNWSTNDPYAIVPSSVEEFNETEWRLMTVQNITYKTIFFQTIKHYKNGTEKTEDGYVEIEGGTGNMTLMAISAHLSVNDSIYSIGLFSTWKINETAVRTYPDIVRETNHLNITWETKIIRYIDNSTINGTLTKLLNYCWDRSTGILVERSYETIEQAGEYLTNMSISYRIVESNVWTVPEFPTWTITLILTVITVALVICKRLLKRQSTQEKRLVKCAAHKRQEKS